MDTIQYNLKNITQKLLEFIPNIKALYLFGSRRHNTKSIRSDIDILIESDFYIKAVNCREFAENICPALDLFVIQGNRAISSMNESYVESESTQDLIQKIHAKLFWDTASGFVKNDQMEWVVETAKGVRFIPTIMPNSFLANDIIRDYFEKVEHDGLPTCPYIGDKYEDVAWFITKTLKRMVLQPTDLCPRGVAKDGWTVDLSATDISRDNMINQHVTTSRCLDALARGNSVKCSTNHSNGSSNFFRNNRSAAVVPSDRFV